MKKDGRRERKNIDISADMNAREWQVHSFCYFYSNLHA